MENLKKDWAEVKALAVDVANAVGRGDTPEYERKRKAILRLLRKLEHRYGEHPSIIATKADYVVRKSDKVRILERALALARKAKDKANIELITEDLAEL